MKSLFQEALRYSAVSACALLVDMAVLAVLVQYFSWWYMAAAALSFSIGVCITYVLSVKVVFKHRRLRNAGAEFASFAALGVVGLMINAVVIFAAVDYLGLHYLIAKCVAAAFTFVCNFVSRRQFLFVQRSSIKV